MRVFINYNVLEKNGKDYHDFSNELNDFIKNLKEHQKNIKNEWNSQNAEIYNTLMDNFINKLQGDSNAMQKYGDIILEINNNFRETDVYYAKKNSTDLLEEMKYGK